MGGDNQGKSSRSVKDKEGMSTNIEPVVACDKKIKILHISSKDMVVLETWWDFFFEIEP